LELWLSGRVGIWILTAGLLRYVYVLCLALFPAKRGDAPRENFGRRAFVGILIGFPLAFIVPGPIGTAVAALSAALIGVSFGRSFLWSYGNPTPPAPSAS
jgi:hypothetical protein